MEDRILYDTHDRMRPSGITESEESIPLTRIGTFANTAYARA
jgi:hypothetical protein